MYVECFELLAETIYYLIDEMKKQKPIFGMTETAIFCNCARILGSMKVYLDLMMKGYYYDANIIYRSLLESMYLVECFIKDKKYAEKWMKYELKFSKVRKELALYSDEATTEFYKELSDFVHANIPAVSTLTESRGERTIDIFFTPTYELEPASLIPRLFPYIGYYMLELLLKSFRDMMKPNIQTKIRKALKKWRIKYQKSCYEMAKELEKKDIQK